MITELMMMAAMMAPAQVRPGGKAMPKQPPPRGHQMPPAKAQSAKPDHSKGKVDQGKTQPAPSMNSAAPQAGGPAEGAEPQAQQATPPPAHPAAHAPTPGPNHTVLVHTPPVVLPKAVPVAVPVETPVPVAVPTPVAVPVASPASQLKAVSASHQEGQAISMDSMDNPVGAVMSKVGGIVQKLIPLLGIGGIIYGAITVRRILKGLLG